MPGTYSGYSGVTADTQIHPSASLWHQVDADMTALGRWKHYWNDFTNLACTASALPTTVGIHLGGLVFTSTGGTFTPTTTAGEQGDVKASSDGDDEGASFSQGIELLSELRD